MLLLPRLLQFDVFQFRLLGLELFALGCLELTGGRFCRLAGAQLVLDRHHVEAVTLPLLLFPAGASHSELLQESTVELLELLFGSFVNNDPVSATADDFVHGNFPGAQHALTQERHTHRTHHQGGELTGFDIKGEAEHAAQLLSRFGDHLAVDHPAVAVRRKAFAQGIG